MGIKQALSISRNQRVGLTLILLIMAIAIAIVAFKPHSTLDKAANAKTAHEFQARIDSLKIDSVVEVHKVRHKKKNNDSGKSTESHKYSLDDVPTFK